MEIISAASPQKYVPPFVFWDAGCKAACQAIYWRCHAAGNFQNFKKRFHCVPDYFNPETGIIEMKYSVDAFRRSIGQLERFRVITDKITYWIFHKFPGKEAYESKYGIRILFESDVARVVSESGNSQAASAYGRMFYDENQVNRSDFWTKSAIDAYFYERIKPFLPGWVIPAGSWYFRKDHAQWLIAVESLRKWYFGLEDFASENNEKLEGHTNAISEYRSSDPRHFFIVKYASPKLQAWVIECLKDEIAGLQRRFGLRSCVLLSSRKQWLFWFKTQSINYFAFFPFDRIWPSYAHDLYSEIVDTKYIDHRFVSKALRLTRDKRPLFLQTTADFDPANHWFAGIVYGPDGNRRPIDSETKSFVHNLFKEINVRWHWSLVDSDVPIEISKLMAYESSQPAETDTRPFSFRT